MKILVVFTGGTIGSLSANGIISPDKSSSYLLLDMYSRVNKDVEFTAVQPYYILSENLCAENLVSLCECIKAQNLSQFDGVIVTHGTDTLQYTSAYLSYVFSMSEKPIVVVSANYPLDDERSNGLTNFCSAVSFIQARQGNGVFVSYTNTNAVPKIHRASKILPHSTYSDSVFSCAENFYGEVINGEFVQNAEYCEQCDEISLSDNYKIKACSDVLYLKPYVGMSYPKLNGKVKAVLLEGYHSGTLSTADDAFRSFCRKASEFGIELFLTGADKGFYYESKTLFDELDIRVLPTASPIAMYMKLWLLDKENIMNVFKPCAGDF